MKKLTYILPGIIIWLIPLLANAQEYKVSPNSKVIIEGTSTMHDWESDVDQVKGQGTFNIDDTSIKEIKNLQVTFVVKSIVSGKSKMDELTYDALKEKHYPNITFKLTEISGINENSISAKGQLTIAGKTNPVNLKGVGKVKGNAVTIDGEHSLNMTDYDVTPPTAMLGAIKVGESVTIKFHLVFTN